MLVDGAGWHKSNAFQFPDNLRLLFLPPYSPGPNPQEHLWDELREKYFHNRVDSLEALEEQLVHGLRALEADHERVESIAGWEGGYSSPRQPWSSTDERILAEQAVGMFIGWALARTVGLAQ